MIPQADHCADRDILAHMAIKSVENDSNTSGKCSGLAGSMPQNINTGGRKSFLHSMKVIMFCLESTVCVV
jgi:hypothetical protein